MEELRARWAHLLPPAAHEAGLSDGLPFVTLSFAQSLDGSIATSRRRALPLSSHDAMVMTHTLRAAHDAILVGVGTVLSDDPQLNARFPARWDRQPRPIVLDRQLRLPRTARLLQIAKPWVFTASRDAEAIAALEALGATVTVAPTDELELAFVLCELRKGGVASVMVEGGATVIGQLLQSAGLVHRLVVTVAPVLVDGLRVSLEPERSRLDTDGLFRRLQGVRYDLCGGDIVVSGTLAPELHLAAPGRT